MDHKRLTSCVLLTVLGTVYAGVNLIFSDGFESGDTSAWGSTVGKTNSLNVNANAAMNATSFGLEILVSGAGNPVFVSSLAATDEPVISVRFWLDPNGITMADGDELVILRARQSGPTADVFDIVFGRTDPSGYHLGMNAQDNDAGLTETAYITIPDAPVRITGVWIQSPDPGPNGLLQLQVGRDAVMQVVANSNFDVDSIRFGAVTGAIDGMSGSFYLDEFESHASDLLANLVYRNGFETPDGG